MAEKLGTYHIAADLRNYEQARSNFFTFIVNDLDNITRASYDPEVGDPTDLDIIPNAQEVLKLSVDASSVPHYTLGTGQIRRGNSVIKYATVPSWDDGQLVVRDYVGIDTKSVLMAWQALAYNVNNDKGGRMADYKKTCTLIEYTQDFVEVRRWIIYGCFITALQEDQFDVTADGERKITCTVPYDRAEMVLPSA